MKKYLRDRQMTDGKLYLSSGDMKNLFLKFHFTSFDSIAWLLFSFRDFIYRKKFEHNFRIIVL